jgi:KaiC/GvpD/RAD55 family RecA-like ATPase
MIVEDHADMNVEAILAEGRMYEEAERAAAGERFREWSSSRIAPGDVERRAAAYLQRIPGAVSGSGGHLHTFTTALHLVAGFGLDERAAYDLLVPWNATCSPPWSEHDLRRKVREAAEKGRASPGYLRDVERGSAAIGITSTAAAAPEVRSAAGPYQTMGEILLAMDVSATRLSTGLPSLDAATNGLPAKKLIVVQGGPGAGKTGLSLQLGVTAAAHGWAVAVLAADEDDAGLVVRVAQMIGFDRHALESKDGHPIRVEAAAKLDDRLPILVVDADIHGATVESVSEELVRRRGERPSMLIIDSIQEARAAGSDDAESPRLRVNAVLKTIKRETKLHGHLTIAISEVSRGRYAAKDKNERTNALAGGKESGGIEYGCAVLMDLSTVADEVGMIDVEIAKNRLGEKTTLRLRQDFARCAFVEVPRPGGTGEGDHDSGPTIDDDVRRVVDALLGCTGPVAGTTGLRGLLLAKGIRMSHARLDGVVAHLGIEERGEPNNSARIVNKGTIHRPRWALKRTADEPDRT